MASVSTVVTIGQNTTNHIELRQSRSAYFRLSVDDRNWSAREGLPSDVLEFAALRAWSDQSCRWQLW